MYKYKGVEVLKINIWDRAVGAVALDENSGYYAFEYEPSFIKSGIELSPVFMPLSKASEPFVFKNLPQETYYRLPAMLADSLPDAFGNAIIEGYMAMSGIDKLQITPLDRLAYMGERAMGALEFFPPNAHINNDYTAIEISHLVKAARSALYSKKISKNYLHQIIKVGTSAGGARAKAVIALNRKTNEILSGQQDAPKGFEHWLLKFDGIGKDKELGVSQNYGRIEYAYYLMAKKAGISMMPCDLFKEGGRAHFITKRFDRDFNKKIHTQTLCAMEHLDFKQRNANDYNQLFFATEHLNLEHEEREECFRRMVFNVLAANCDDHSKNFSFILKENSKWELSPAYDITHAYNPKSEWTNCHLMSVNGKFSDITKKDFFAVAEKFNIYSASEIIEQVENAIFEWNFFAKKAGVKLADRKKIAENHKLFSIK